VLNNDESDESIESLLSDIRFHVGRTQLALKMIKRTEFEFKLENMSDLGL
jgi:hypothetical protein